MSTELATIETTEIQLAYTSPNGIDILLERIRKEASSEVPDLTTAKGRARIASLAHKVSKTKVMVDDYGKELVAEEKKRLALIDADRKKWRDECDAIRDAIRKPLTDWEQAEADRVQRHKEGIASITCMSNCDGMTAECIAISIAALEETPMGEMWEEFAGEAASAKDKALFVMRSALAARQQYEAEQEELARLREEAARREQEERERRIAEEAAAKARADAEAKAKAEREAAEAKARAEQEAAERARIAAEQAEARAKAEAEAAKLREQDAERRRVEAEARAEREAKEAAERAERDRVAAIEAERQRAERQRIAEQEAAAREQAAREADKENRRNVNRAALEGIMAAGISEEQGKALIALIAAGKVAHISITY